MGELLGPLAGGLGIYAVTNIDDIVGVTTLFLTARASGFPRRWQIWVGEYLAFALLISLCVVVAAGLTLVPDHWIGLIGLVPFSLGVRALTRAVRSPAGAMTPASSTAVGLVSVITVAIGGGVDSTAVYVFAYRTMSPGVGILTTVGLVIGVALCCLLGDVISSSRPAIELMRRLDRWAVPIVFMTIGTVILFESGTITDIASMIGSRLS